jgi:ArsR family transcriptional regulator, cadmium/lead-responsive transcriptional repressor
MFNPSIGRALITPAGSQVVSIMDLTYIKVGVMFEFRDLADFDWHAYGVVVGSEYRKKVVGAIARGPKSPKQISNITGLRLNHVSKTLKELEKITAVECLTPDLRKGRLYQLTGLGRQILGKL